NPQSLNLYSYVLNDATNFIDPSGLFLRPGRVSPPTLGPEGAGSDHLPRGPVWVGPKKTPPPPRFNLGIREPNQSFNQCMAANANTYSLGGAAQLIGNTAAGTVVTFLTDNPIASGITGNMVNTFFFGSTAE